MISFIDTAKIKTRRFITTFLRDTKGAALVEFAICLPFLLLMLAGAAVVQDSIRVGYINSKASYTLADMISREDESIDRSYFDGLDSIFDYMTDDRYPSDLRMTTIECTANCTDEDERVLEVCWSRASDGFTALANDDIDDFADQTPLFAAGDTMIITETYLDYTPLAFNFFFDPSRYEAVAFTRPRIVNQIKFDTGLTDIDGNQVFMDCFNNDV